MVRKDVLDRSLPTLCASAGPALAPPPLCYEVYRPAAVICMGDDTALRMPPGVLGVSRRSSDPGTDVVAIEVLALDACASCCAAVVALELELEPEAEPVAGAGIGVDAPDKSPARLSASGALIPPAGCMEGVITLAPSWD